MGRQFRILAIALGVVAVWWLLWRSIDSPNVPGSKRASGEPPAKSEAIEDDSARPPQVGVDLTDDARESLGQPGLPNFAVEEVAEPPSGPKLRLFGSLTDDCHHEPIPDGSFKLVDSLWDEKIAHSNLAGEYAFEDLQAGSFELSVEAPGRRTLRTTVELKPEELELRLDLAMTRGDILKVKLVGATSLDFDRVPWRNRSGLGEESARLQPIVTLMEPSGWLSDAAARGSDVGTFVDRSPSRLVGGKWTPAEVEAGSLQDRIRLPDGTRIDDLPPVYCGVFVLSKPLPVFASLVHGDLALQTRAVPPGTDEVTFGFTREDYDKLSSEVRLRVVDGDTESPPGWTNVLLGQRLAGRRGSRKEADGTIVFEEVLPGRVPLSISADEREIMSEHVLVLPGQVTDLGLYRLRPLARILCKVVDDAGQPAQVAFNVFPFDRYAATRDALAKRFFCSNLEGDMKIDSVGRGRYLILANQEGWVSMPALADTTLGDHEDLEVLVSKGTPVALRLRAEPLPGARLEIRTRSGLPVAERKCRDRDPMRFLLVPGTYSIELWDGETWLASETLVVGKEPVRLYFPR